MHPFPFQKLSRNPSPSLLRCRPCRANLLERVTSCLLTPLPPALPPPCSCSSFILPGQSLCPLPPGRPLFPWLGDISFVLMSVVPPSRAPLFPQAHKWQNFQGSGPGSLFISPWTLGNLLGPADPPACSPASCLFRAPGLHIWDAEPWAHLHLPPPCQPDALLVFPASDQLCHHLVTTAICHVLNVSAIFCFSLFPAIAS